MTYPEFVDWCGTERTAHFLSDKVNWKTTTSEDMEDVVIRLLVQAKFAADAAGEDAELEYYGGERRDTIRDRANNYYPLRLNRCDCGGRHIASFCNFDGANRL